MLPGASDHSGWVRLHAFSKPILTILFVPTGGSFPALNNQLGC